MLFGTTGMIIGALQESSSSPANVKGGEAKEPDGDGAFAALLFAVVALLQPGVVVPTAESSEESSLAAGGEDAAAPQIACADAEAQALAADNPAQTITASAVADTDSPAVSTTPVAAHPEDLAPRAPVDGKVAREAQAPIEVREKIEALPAEPSDRVSRAGVAEVARAKEEFTPGPNASRGEEHKSIQGRIHEAVAVPANNPMPARPDDGQKSFNRDAHALPVAADEKNPPPKDPLAPGGFALEPAIARQETQTRPEAEPINWRPTVERLAGDIAGQVRIGARDAIIQLDPPELGKIKIDLRMDGDKLLAHISTESPEAQSLLRNHLPELHQALQSQQVNLAEVRVWNGNGSSAAGGFAQNFQQAPGQRQPGGWLAGNAQGERGAANEPPGAQRFSSGSGRVSVWA